MNTLLKGLSELVLSPTFLAMVVIAVVFVVVRRWSHFRSRRKSLDEQIAALTPLAASTGGTVTDQQGDTTAWSAGVRGPVVEHVEGFLAKLLRRCKPSWDLAFDVQRGPWHVRVTEASVRVSNPSGYGVRWEQEHRIEVATARIAPMRIIRPSKRSSGGTPLTDSQIEKLWGSWPAQAPMTAENDHAGWQRIPISPPMDKEFIAYGSDPAAASRELNFDALHWLIDRGDELPIGADRLRLTFESGFAYIVLSDHIEPDVLMGVVDTICGLLDRMPGVRPRHPAAAV